MLTALWVRDVVLIDSLELEPVPGLSVLTGETGAGKSILLDALGLALGARAEGSLVRDGAKQAAVTAEFRIGAARQADLAALLASEDIACEDTLILRRTVNSEGRSRAFINDQPVTAGLLRRVAGTLVEVHGQFQTHGLTDPKTHLSLLDSFGGLTAEAEKVAAAWRAWRQVDGERRQLEAEQQAAAEEKDSLNQALEQIDELDPKPGEEAALNDRREVLRHAGQVLEAMNAANAELDTAANAMGAAQRTLDRAADKAGDSLRPVIDALDRTGIELQEALSALQSVAADIDSDPEALERTEDRLFAIRDLARKHRVDPDQLPELRTQLADRLALLSDSADRLDQLGRQTDLARQTFLTGAEALSEKRVQAAANLDAAVNAELSPLKLEKARFETKVERQGENGAGPKGFDQVEFLVATNPGAAPGPLGRIASGGELARFMLALKVVLHGDGSVPVLIFDEVDAGIGGATADAVGERLAQLGAEAQVLVVTHSPQVAARGEAHWRVSKLEQKDRTVTRVEPLDAQERHEEIARMLSGARITKEARAAAARLLEAGA